MRTEIKSTYASKNASYGIKIIKSIEVTEYLVYSEGKNSKQPDPLYLYILHAYRYNYKSISVYNIMHIKSQYSCQLYLHTDIKLHRNLYKA